MNMKKQIAIAVGFFALFGASTGHAEEYTFEVENGTSVPIVQVLVSEDGEDWGYFSMDGNVAAGDTGTLTWGEHTNNETCVQWIQVGFEDGTTSEASQFDFCNNPSLVVH